MADLSKKKNDVAKLEPPVLEVRDLKQEFIQNRFSQKNKVHALNGVSFTLKKGETLGIVGETGCGKSTLCRTIMGLYKPSAGSILLDGEDLGRGLGLSSKVRKKRQALQMIFQDPGDSMNPRLTVGAIIAEPLIIKTHRPEQEHQSFIVEILEQVGLNSEVLDRYPHEFSGGQRQRIALARALVLNPRILICDEAVSALDVSVQAQILNLLLQMQKRYQLSMIFVSHALGLVRHMSDRVIVLYLGSIMEEASSMDLYRKPLHPYTQTLLAAYPDLESQSAKPHFYQARPKDRADNQEPPSPVNLPKGCPYQNFCPLLVNRCREEFPLLRDLGQGHKVACHQV